VKLNEGERDDDIANFQFDDDALSSSSLVIVQVYYVVEK
jgi:hypothetical protein